MSKQKANLDSKITDKFEAHKETSLSSPIDWEKVLERYIKEVKGAQSWGQGPGKEFVRWLAKNQDILSEFQDKSKQYVINENGDVSAVFDVNVCSTCVHSKIRRDIPRE